MPILKKLCHFVKKKKRKYWIYVCSDVIISHKDPNISTVFMYKILT